MSSRIEFSGPFTAPARMNIEPGAYYLGFKCHVCAHDVAILDAPTEGDPIAVGGDATFRVQCPRCGEARAYAAGEMKMWQAATGRP